MLYTVTSPADAYDRIRLFPDAEAARATAGDERAVLMVAVDFDALMRRVIPLWTDPHAFNPDWWAPAQPHPDGSVTARGPIPTPLFGG
jgi:hypothetical protein